MKTLAKNLTNILLVVAIVAVVGLYFKKGPETQIVQLAGTVGSSVGTTFGTARIAQINLSPTVAATTTGILNTDSSDRYIESTYLACSGVGTSQIGYVGGGLANLLFNVATGTTQAPARITNAQVISTQVSTSTTDVYVASTTIQTALRIWPTGTYLNFEFNATNTAACTVGAHYLAS